MSHISKKDEKSDQTLCSKVLNSMVRECWYSYRNPTKNCNSIRYCYKIFHKIKYCMVKHSAYYSVKLLTTKTIIVHQYNTRSIGTTYQSANKNLSHNLFTVHHIKTVLRSTSKTRIQQYRHMLGILIS